MRLLVDSLIALMLAAVLGCLLVYHSRQEAQTLRHQEVQHALSSLREQVVVHAEVDADSGKYEYPRFVEPDWFNQVVPINVLITGRRPWIDVAPLGDRNDQPPDPVLTNSDQASFWYNPNSGVFRARVPHQLTDEQTLHMYNTVNSSTLSDLPGSLDPKRRPTPMPLVRKAPKPGEDEQPTQETSARVAQ